jgi:hypothetical protein
MGKYTIVAEYSARWTETHEVEVPEGLTSAELDDWLTEWHEKHTPDGPDPLADIECEESDVRGYEHAPPDLTPPSIPKAGWFVAQGARWATDGHILFREGSPMPATMADQHGYIRSWLTSETLSHESVETILGQAHRQSEHPGLFHPRMAPVFDGAEVFGGGLLDPAFVWRGGVLTAVVMPLRVDPEDKTAKRIRATGAPVGAA